MSMPNIPDITPTIDINRDDALNMLIASIAMEEMGLAHIINAEGEKIQSILRSQECRNVSVPEIIAVNQSVEKVIKETRRLQMLLQEKLETVVSLIPKAPVSPGVPRPQPCRPKSRSSCILAGRGNGFVSNESDFFHCAIASVESDECSNNKGCPSISLKYTLCKEKENCTASTLFLAIPGGVKVYCPNRLSPCPGPQEPNVLIMQGDGIMTVDRCGEPPAQCAATFTLTVWDCGCNKKFQMVICSPNSEFDHDSGIVLMRSGNLEIKKI